MCLIRLGRKGGREGGREEEEEQVTFSWLIDPMTPSPSSPPPLPPPVPKPHRQHHTGEAPAGGRDGFHDCRQRDRKHPARTRRLRLLVRYVALACSLVPRFVLPSCRHLTPSIPASAPLSLSPHTQDRQRLQRRGGQPNGKPDAQGPPSPHPPSLPPSHRP